MESNNKFSDKLLMVMNKAYQFVERGIVSKVNAGLLLAVTMTSDCWTADENIGTKSELYQILNLRVKFCEATGRFPITIAAESICIQNMIDPPRQADETNENSWATEDVHTVVSSIMQDEKVTIAKLAGELLAEIVKRDEYFKAESYRDDTSEIEKYALECYKILCPRILDNDMDEKAIRTMVNDELEVLYTEADESDEDAGDEKKGRLERLREICWIRYFKLYMAANNRGSINKQNLIVTSEEEEEGFWEELNPEQDGTESNNSDNNSGNNGMPGMSIGIIGNGNMPTGVYIGIPRMMGMGKGEPEKKNVSALEEMGRDMLKYMEEQHKKNGGVTKTVFGRDTEIELVFETLGRKTKSNICLVGEPGVGKTAIANGIAEMMLNGNAPYYLEGYKMYSIDTSKIVAETEYRGQFEEKMNALMEEAMQEKCILFFDEMHTIMGAGSASNSNMDAANILKTAMADGSIKIIGATTPKEYKKYISSDNAFERRVQRINVDELSVPDAIKVVGDVAPLYAGYHECIFDESAIESAVVLSDKFITNRKLPDKAIDLLDTTAARKRAGFMKNKPDEGFHVSGDDIKETICKLENIRISDIGRDVTSRDLKDRIQSKIKGQDGAVKSVVKAVKRAEAGIRDPKKPIANFLFVGPTGVGKTELAKRLAVELMGSEKKLIRIDMSEFMESHSVSKLIGSPPGYVGHGEGGLLTEAVKRNCNSVILFDEIEKANNSVINILLQIMDDGILTDACGETVSLKNCIIIMTSNTGFSVDTKNRAGEIGFGSNNTRADRESKILDEEVKNTFKPEFLNRIDEVVKFSRLSRENCIDIVKDLLDDIKVRMEDKDVRIEFSDDVCKKIVELGYSDEYGARNVKRTIQVYVEDIIADAIIEQGIDNVHELHLSVVNGDIVID